MRASAPWLVAGAGATAVAQLTLLALIARFQGGLELLGVYGLATAVIGVARTAAEMGLRAVAATDYRLSENLRLYAKVRAGSMLVASALSLLGCLLTSIDRVDLVFVSAVLALKMAESGADLCYGVFQRASRARDQGVSMAGRAVLTVAGLGLGAAAGLRSDLAMLIAAAASWIWFLTYDVTHSSAAAATLSQQLEQEGAPRQPRVDLAGLLRTCWPIGAAGMFGAITQAAPRIMLDLFATRVAVGLWTAAFTVGQALSLPNQALVNAQMGHLTRTYALQGAAAHWRSVRRGMLVTFGVMLVLAPIAYGLAPDVMRLLYGPEAVTTATVLALIICSRLLDEAKGYLKLVQITQRRTIPYLVGTIVTSVMALVLAYALVPDLQLVGAGAAVLTTSLITFIAGFSFIAWRLASVPQEGGTVR